MRSARFNLDQFGGIQPVPIDCSPALNLIGVHPALIEFAKRAIGCDDVYIYQCRAWAKFTGDADYDQPFHCDFGNHTLTVALEEDSRDNPITILCYFSDVTEALARPTSSPARTATRSPDPEATLGTRWYAALQDALKPYEQSSGRPRRQRLPLRRRRLSPRHQHDRAHGGHRYALMACFRAAGNDAVSYHAWPFHFRQPWNNIFDHATPEQLACFGVQRPGDPFWTETTLARAQTRYPNWDMTPYREAMKDPEKPALNITTDACRR